MSESDLTKPYPLRPKKRHTKSMLGCKTCKRRRVKCDELYPLCGNCARRSKGILYCDFDKVVSLDASLSDKSLDLTSLPNSMRTLAPKPKPMHSNITLRPTGIRDWGVNRALELRLMHHYSTSACYQMLNGKDPRGYKTLEIDVPQIAFSCDFLLNTILGISAQHLRSLTPDDRSLVHATDFYLGNAAARYRDALSNIDSSNAEPLMLTSALIAGNSLIPSCDETGGKPYTLPMQPYRLLQGIHVVFQRLEPWIIGTKYMWIFEQEPISSLRKAQQSSFLDRFRMDLNRLLTADAGVEIKCSDQATYAEAAEYLISLCSAVESGVSSHKIQRAIVSMPGRLPPRFCDMLEQKDPRAMALLARNFAMVKFVEVSWWIQGALGNRFAEHRVRGICDLMPSRCLWMMDWPLKVISGELQPCVDVPRYRTSGD